MFVVREENSIRKKYNHIWEARIVTGNDTSPSDEQDQTHNATDDPHGEMLLIELFATRIPGESAISVVAGASLGTILANSNVFLPSTWSSVWWGCLYVVTAFTCAAVIHFLAISLISPLMKIRETDNGNRLSRGRYVKTVVSLFFCLGVCLVFFYYSSLVSQESDAVVAANHAENLNEISTAASHTTISLKAEYDTKLFMILMVFVTWTMVYFLLVSVMYAVHRTQFSSYRSTRTP